jgi:hypothetical protein
VTAPDLADGRFGARIRVSITVMPSLRKNSSNARVRRRYPGKSGRRRSGDSHLKHQASTISIVAHASGRPRRLSGSSARFWQPYFSSRSRSMPGSVMTRACAAIGWPRSRPLKSGRDRPRRPGRSRRRHPASPLPPLAADPLCDEHGKTEPDREKRQEPPSLSDPHRTSRRPALRRSGRVQARAAARACSALARSS